MVMPHAAATVSDEGTILSEEARQTLAWIEALDE